MGVIKGGILKVSLAPASPHKNFNRCTYRNKFEEGLSIRGFVGVISGDATQGSWVSPSRDDECIDNKTYSESLIENILPIATKYLYGCNQCQVQFYKPFSSLQLITGI